MRRSTVVAAAAVSLAAIGLAVVGGVRKVTEQTGLGVGACDSPNSRLLLGITATGTASVDFATSHAEPKGDGPLGWTAKTY